MTRWCRTTWAAERLGVSDSTVRRMADAGLIPGRRFDTGWWQLDRRAVELLANPDADFAESEATLQPERNPGRIDP